MDDEDKQAYGRVVRAQEELDNAQAIVLKQVRKLALAHTNMHNARENLRECRRRAMAQRARSLRQKREQNA